MVGCQRQVGCALEVAVDGGVDGLRLDAVLKHDLDAHAVGKGWGDDADEDRARL